jgi:putative FmdB family regulatory protein
MHAVLHVDMERFLKIVRSSAYTPSMPLYEYECGSCGHLFELLRGMSDADPACPSCASVQVLRRISVFAASTSSGFRSSAPSGGGCACGGSCMCGGH